HIYYEGKHIPIATLDGMRDHTITISGASKTFSVTGWRVGTIIAPPEVTDAIRKVHDFLTVGAPAPLQEAIAVGLETLGPEYYRGLAVDYRARRDLLHGALLAAGFRCEPPEGAYYILADFSALSDLPDDAFARWLTCEAGVAPVPGSSFFSRPELGRQLVRFAFCKTEEQLREAGERLQAVKGGRERPPSRRCRRRRRPDVATAARGATARRRTETPAPPGGAPAPRRVHRSGRHDRTRRRRAVAPAPASVRSAARTTR